MRRRGDAATPASAGKLGRGERRGQCHCCAFRILAILVAATGVVRADETAEAIRAAAGRVAPSVVTIETVGGTQPTDDERSAAFVVADGPTTGLVWSADGLILTSSFNFVRDPSVISVVLADGRRFVAELLARDEIRRLAMLKIAAADLPAPSWVESAESLRTGQWAISLGRGHGPLSGDGADATGGCTITAGIVSGVGRMSGLVIQTDARLSPANFGGPLVDIEGRVLGICVPIGLDPGQLSGVEWYDSGIGFAVPREQVEASAAELAGRHNVRRGLLGVGLGDVVPGFVTVVGCGDPSPALRAGVQPGDRILAVDGAPVHNAVELKRMLRPRSAGTKVTLRLARGDRELDLPVTLAVPEDIGPIAGPARRPREPRSPGSAPATEPSEPSSRPADPWFDSPRDE